jgi:serine/threonine-protein kinase RsbT
MEDGIKRVLVRGDGDIVNARTAAKALAEHLGFEPIDIVLIAAAVSEAARNIVEHTKGGEIILSVQSRGQNKGLEIVAQDRGPGIADIAGAMQEGYSTTTGLGLGLPGMKRLMDEFDIVSRVGFGTKVTMRKWLC